MVVNAVLTLDQEELNEKLIGIKRIPGGAMQDSLLINGVAFKKTFSYAGFEQQPKSFKNPKILSLNVELELKAEKDNAEVRIEDLEAIVKTGAKVVLSKLPIGDLATQYFADRDIFCAGRVPAEDLNRVVNAVGGSIQSTCSDIEDKHLGTCESFDERQIGGERFNLLNGCPAAKTCTLILRGGAEQFIAEVERSLHDAIMIVKRTIKNNLIVAGGAIWYGVDINSESVADNFAAFVWEPALVKTNSISAATEAACLILSVDETVKNPASDKPQAGPPMPRGGMQRALKSGRGRGIPLMIYHYEARNLSSRTSYIESAESDKAK
ncbi:13756_t:CDS:2, partial [Racocetra fulgida]